MTKSNKNYRMAIAPLIAVLAIMSTPVFASPIDTFTNRADWQTAAGTPDWTVDFGGFASDTSFTTSPVDLGSFSISQVGVMDFHNVIKASGVADVYTNFGAITVDITFDTPVYAWGADFSGLDGELLNIELFGGINTTIEVNQTTGFFGFTVPSSTPINKISLISRTEIAGLEGETFTMDNAAGVVPEPATMSLLALGGLAMLRRRRK